MPGLAVGSGVGVGLAVGLAVGAGLAVSTTATDGYGAGVDAQPATSAVIRAAIASG